MKVLVTGSTGMLGYDVYNESVKRGYDTYGVGRSNKGNGLIEVYTKLDLTDDIKTYDYILNLKPDVIIHCAAWTDVNGAEDDNNHNSVRDINVNATKYIALCAERLKCKMVYISSDYVFNGEGTRPWKPDDKLFGPLNFYGSSKLDGEFEVVDYVDKFFVVRTSWLFGLNGNNFASTILKFASFKESLQVVDDQIGCVTYTKDLAKFLLDLIETENYGFYHATNCGGYISWYDFTKEILLQGRYFGVGLVSITSDKYKSAAKRPSNSRLNISKIKDTGFDQLPHWKDALSRYLEERHIIESSR